MHDEHFLRELKRKTVVTGHFGSGKTEFSVSLALMLAGSGSPLQSAAAGVALVDLDVIKPYFRSREQRELLEGAGISVYGSLYKHEITAELPALGATIRTPLESKDTRVIIDLGGNDSGALIANQFAKYFSDDETMITAVVNANRPDTATVAAILEHIAAIEAATGFTVSHLINNTHMLRETTTGDIKKGHALCLSACENSGKTILCDCYPADVVSAEELEGLGLSDNLMPMGLHLRPTWFDIVCQGDGSRDTNS